MGLEADEGLEVIVYHKNGMPTKAVIDGKAIKVDTSAIPVGSVPDGAVMKVAMQDLKEGPPPWEGPAAAFEPVSGLGLTAKSQVLANETPVFNNVPVEVKAATAHTKKKGKTGAVVETAETLYKVVSTIPLANIGFKAAQTVNLGNYESCKIEVMLNLPCLVSEIDETYKFANEWVDGKMAAIMKEVQASKGS